MSSDLAGGAEGWANIPTALRDARKLQEARGVSEAWARRTKSYLEWASEFLLLKRGFEGSSARAIHCGVEDSRPKKTAMN